MTIIQLIQSQANKYKLDGQDKLRFTEVMPEADDRLLVLNKLLDDLQKTS